MQNVIAEIEKELQQLHEHAPQVRSRRQMRRQGTFGDTSGAIEGIKNLNVKEHINNLKSVRTDLEER